MPHVVIIGAGISGLAAAHSALAVSSEQGERLEITVLEADHEVGGKARTVLLDAGGGALVETGPNGYLNREPVLRRLIETCGLKDSVVNASEENRHRYIYRDGLHEVSPNPVRLWRGGLLSGRGFLRVLREPMQRSRPTDLDETLHEFAARRLGIEAAERAVAPMALGVYAGDSRLLCAAAAFPLLTKLESEHGSLFAGLRAQRKRRRETGSEPPQLTSLREGLQELPRALASSRRLRVLTGARCKNIVPAGSAWRCTWNSSPTSSPYSSAAATRAAEADGADSLETEVGIVADSVVIATEGPAAANLLRPLSSFVSDQLDAIPCPGMAVVAMLLRRRDLPELPAGFGVLVARSGGTAQESADSASTQQPRALGCLWESQIFPGRSDHDHVLVRSLFGGQVDPSVLELDDDALSRTALADLTRMTPTQGSPIAVHITRWPHAIPQYIVGHQRRVERISEGLDALPGLFLAGNVLEGVAFAEAAATGWRRGAQAAHHALARSRHQP